MQEAMTNKEKADCLIELHKVQLEHFMQTRDIEFKVNIALWTLIALSGSFLYGKLNLTGCQWWIYGIFALVIYLGHMFLWIMPIQKSADTDDYYINLYRSKVEALVEITLPKPTLKCKLLTRLRLGGWSWILAETGITLILLVLIGVLLSLN